MTNAVKHFFEILGSHPTLSDLAKEVPDPSADNDPEYQLIILCRGVKNSNKYNILNTSLLFVGMNMKLLGNDHIDLTKR